MSKFKITFIKQAMRLLVPVLRKIKHQAWLKTLLSRFQSVHNERYEDRPLYQSETSLLLEQAKYNSRRLVLEFILNKTFGTQYRHPAAQNEIYINNTSNDIPEVFLYDDEEPYETVILRAETEPEVDQSFIYDEEEYYPEFDFTVNVPNAIFTPALVLRIRACVDQYNHTGISYNVIGY